MAEFAFSSKVYGFFGIVGQQILRIADNPDMTLPRQYLSGSTYMITRRISERRFFLRPDPFVEQAFGYLLAVLTKRYKVEWSHR